MSIIGTSVAAGVAGTAHTAQQIARQRDKQQAERQRAAERLRDLYETQLRGIEEPDESDNSARVHIDDQLPDHEQAHDAQSYDVLHKKQSRDGLTQYSAIADAVELSQQARDDTAAPSAADDQAREPLGPTYPPSVANRFKHVQEDAQSTIKENPRLDIKA